MFNFKKPLAFITGIICSTICFRNCSALERNELGIITALTKDATIEEKIGEAYIACSEYLDRLNAEPELVEYLMNEPYGTVIFFNKNDTDIDTYYGKIIRGNFGLEEPLMDYVLTLLKEAGVNAVRLCRCEGKDKPLMYVEETKNIEYYRLVAFEEGKEDCYIFDFYRLDDRLFLCYEEGRLE